MVRSTLHNYLSEASIESLDYESKDTFVISILKGLAISECWFALPNCPIQPKKLGQLNELVLNVVTQVALIQLLVHASNISLVVQEGAEPQICGSANEPWA